MVRCLQFMPRALESQGRVLVGKQQDRICVLLGGEWTEKLGAENRGRPRTPRQALLFTGEKKEAQRVSDKLREAHRAELEMKPQPT